MPKTDAPVSMEQIKELRALTGAGVSECKKILEEAGGSLDEALKILRAKGADVAAAKAHRVTGQGIIGSYVHGGKIGVLVEVNCETDFVARNEDFKKFVHEVCLQVASMNPQFISVDEVPTDVSEKERKVLESHVLLSQPYVKDSSKTVEDLLHETVNAIRENIRIKRFVRFTLGEETPPNKSA